MSKLFKILQYSQFIKCNKYILKFILSFYGIHFIIVNLISLNLIIYIFKNNNNDNRLKRNNDHKHTHTYM